MPIVRKEYHVEVLIPILSTVSSAGWPFGSHPDAVYNWTFRFRQDGTQELQNTYVRNGVE